MKDEDRSLVKGLLGALVLGLLISGGLKVFEDLQGNPAVCGFGGSSDQSLGVLAPLSFSISSSSTPAQDLRNGTYWSKVGASYSSTIAQLVPQTVLGFVQGSSMWKNWSEQYMLEPPSWIADGPIPELDGEYHSLETEAINSTDSATAMDYVTNFAFSVSGYTLEALDFVTFNGLTSLKTYFETGSAEQALCASFPGQLAQLYHTAFDSSVPSDSRAQALGSALAITSVISILGGLGGFSDEFQGALAGSGLDGAWDTMKSSFAKLGAISPDGANLALMVLQKLSQRFPGDIGGSAGFTVDRIAAMAEVLHNDGDPNSDIDQKIGSLIQAAGSATGPDDVATDADVISYEDGGGIQVTLDTQNRMYEYTEDGTMRRLPASLMEELLPGFGAGENIPIAIRYEEKGITVYYYYSGGSLFQPTVPGDVGQPGDVFTINFAILTRNPFINSLPEMDFEDPVAVHWVVDISHLTSYSVQGDQITLNFVQEPAPEELSHFSILGQLDSSTGFGSPSGFYVDVQITDLFGNDRTLRIYYSGYGLASMGINTGAKFSDVELVSFDGLRQVIVYQKSTPTADYNEAVFYPIYPSTVYTIGDMNPYPFPDYEVSGVSADFFINDVTTTRSLEYEMLTQGSLMDIGRVGAEIGYTVATEKLGLENVIMINPNQPGPDLYTPGFTTIIEARMLQRTAYEFGSVQTQDIQNELQQMVDRVQGELATYNSQSGYVIFSYLDNDKTIHTIVLVVD